MRSMEVMACLKRNCNNGSNSNTGAQGERYIAVEHGLGLVEIHEFHDLDVIKAADD